MIFDINTATGHWPFRRIPHEKLPALKNLLESKGIKGAAVVNTHGLFYKNCHDANIELAEALSGEPFFIGIATINPAYPAWERDLQACVSSFSMKGVRIAPQYHDYRLGSSFAREILSAATSMNLPVFIPSRVVDTRQRHWLDTNQTLDIREIGEFSLSVPSSRIIVTECSVSSSQVLDKKKKPLYPGLYFEISRMSSAYGQEIAKLAKLAGTDRLLFGSGAPFKEVTPALLKLEAIDCTQDVRKQIAYKNAHQLLGI